MIYVFRIYQVIIALPLCLVATLLASVITIIGCFTGPQRFFSYYPAKVWAQVVCLLNFVRVRVHGRSNIDRRTSYVFVANHQGAFDIFSIYGYLGHQFKWMMKIALRKIPFVGYSCYKAGHIYVDRSSPAAVRQTIETAEQRLRGGMSVVVFPEGSRSRNGRIGTFKRGAYFLATEFNLPVVPVTIDGAYRVMPRHAKLPRPGRIDLTIHRPIAAGAEGHDMANLIEQSRAAIVSALPAESAD